LTFALVQDMEQRFWVVETCPAGTHVWTLDQAADLATGTRTRQALREIIREGRSQQAAVLLQSAAKKPLWSEPRKPVRLMVHEGYPVPKAERADRSHQRSVRRVATLLPA
jgi:hypothetical protein